MEANLPVSEISFALVSECLEFDEFSVTLCLSLSPQTARISLFSARESKQTALDLFPSQTHTTSLLPKPLTGPVHLISSSIYLDHSSFA